MRAHVWPPRAVVPAPGKAQCCSARFWATPSTGSAHPALQDGQQPTRSGVARGYRFWDGVAPGASAAWLAARPRFGTVGVSPLKEHGVAGKLSPAVSQCCRNAAGGLAGGHHRVRRSFSQQVPFRADPPQSLSKARWRIRQGGRSGVLPPLPPPLGRSPSGGPNAFCKRYIHERHLNAFN